MMKTGFFVSTIFLTALQAYASDCQWITFYVDQDTTVLESFPDQVQNHQDEVLRISAMNSTWQNGTPGRQRVFLRFDLGNITPGYVEHAQFEIYQTDSINYPGQFVIESISGKWEQLLLTWNNQPPVESEPVALLDNGADQLLSVFTPELALLAENWIRFPKNNQGIRIRFDDEFFNGNPNGVRGDSFRSREVQGELPARITLLICEPCLGDFDFNRQVDFFDISAFLVYYQIQSPLADLNQDGMINFFDVSTLLNAYTLCN